LACFAVEQDMSVVYIDVAEESDQMLKSMQRIGNIAPLHCTGIGKLFLLNYSDSEIDRLIHEKGLPRFTENTISDKESLLRALEVIRNNGYAYDNEECEVGARCIAYPIRDYTGKVVAGLSITGPTSRLTSEAIEKNRLQLKSVAKTISQNMGYEEI
jgi:DNA-binding IclR family transcriptional regulator